MDQQLRQLERRVASGDTEAMQPLARWHQRNGSRLSGLSIDQLKELLRDACNAGYVPRVAIPIKNSLLRYLRISIQTRMVCTQGCEPSCDTWSHRERAFRVVQQYKGHSYVCGHNHHAARKGHRLAKQCAKRRARQVILQTIEKQDSKALERMLAKL